MIILCAAVAIPFMIVPLGQVINGIDIKSPAIKNFYKNRLRLRQNIDNTYSQYLKNLYKNIFTYQKSNTSLIQASHQFI